VRVCACRRREIENCVSLERAHLNVDEEQFRAAFLSLNGNSRVPAAQKSLTNTRDCSAAPFRVTGIAEKPFANARSQPRTEHSLLERLSAGKRSGR